MSTNARDQYGCIKTPSNAARAIVAQASKSKKIPASFDDMSWAKRGGRSYREGAALHHEICDYTTTQVLVCCREVEGTKYGVKTLSKTYFVVRKHGRGVTATEASKAVAAKAAKAAVELGDALAVVQGKQKLKNPTMATRTGFKMVRRDAAGALVSAWDGSPWDLGVTRAEKSTDDHTGGFYYYASAEEAIQAALENNIFSHHRDHERLVLVEVEVKGRQHKIGSGKICATYMRPIREVFQLI